MLYSLLSNYLARRIYCSNGPNDVWYCGYDIIKQYGFPIHGGLDGFSRKILRLKVVRSNSNHIAPAALYWSAIKKQGLCPNLLKTDCGSENGDIVAVHCFLTGSKLPYRYGALCSNQRIENWWSHLKRWFSAWVIDYFKQLVHDGIYVPGNVAHMECICFGYANFLQCKLDIVKNEFNLHTIRCTKGCQVSGIPSHLYYSMKPIWLMYYHKGILKKSSNRSWKEVTVSYKSTFVAWSQANKWVILLLTGRIQKTYL